jgi:hypothetical protein
MMLGDVRTYILTVCAGDMEEFVSQFYSLYLLSKKDREEHLLVCELPDEIRDKL